MGACTSSPGARMRRAARQGRIHRLQDLIAQCPGAVGSSKDKRQRSAVHWAVRGGHHSCVRLLLAAGAPADDADRSGCTALLLAAGEGKEACVRALLSAGARPDMAAGPGGTTPLHEAVKGGYDATVRALLTAGGASTEAADDAGRTALHYAARDGRGTCIRLLLGGGAEPDMPDADGLTALHWAAKGGSVAAARLLIKSGADPTACTVEGQTAVQLAEAAGHADVAELLAEVLQLALESSPAPASPVLVREAVPQPPGTPDAAAEAAAAAAGHGEDSEGSLGAPDEPPVPSPPAQQPPMPGAEAAAAANGARSGTANGAAAPAAPKASRSWLISARELHVLRQVGGTACRQVHQAKWKHAPVAVKLLLPGQHGGRSRREARALRRAFKGPSSTLERTRHPNCVAVLGYCSAPAAIITEYCPRGSLLDLLLRARGSPAVAAQLTWARRLSLALDAATGVLHLHTLSPPVIHGGLKSSNILIDEAYRAKVADFQLAGGTSSKLARPTEDPRWQAPELLEHSQPNEATDAWAFGTCLWELLTWQQPYEGMSTDEVAHYVMDGGRLEVPALRDLPGSDTPLFSGLESYMTLTWSCWEEDPAERPTFQQIVNELRLLLKSAPCQPASTRRECGICQREFQRAELRVLVPCRHDPACPDCTKELLAHSSPCPICGSRISTSIKQPEDI